MPIQATGSNKGTVFHRYPDSGQQAVKVGLSLPLYYLFISLLTYTYFTFTALVFHFKGSCFATPFHISAESPLNPFQNHQKACIRLVCSLFPESDTDTLGDGQGLIWLAMPCFVKSTGSAVLL